MSEEHGVAAIPDENSDLREHFRFIAQALAGMAAQMEHSHEALDSLGKLCFWFISFACKALLRNESLAPEERAAFEEIGKRTSYVHSKIMESKSKPAESEEKGCSCGEEGCGSCECEV